MTEQGGQPGIDPELEQHIQSAAGELGDDIHNAPEGQRDEAIVAANEVLRESGVRLVIDERSEDRAIRRERLLHQRRLAIAEVKDKIIANRIRVNRGL